MAADTTILTDIDVWWLSNGRAKMLSWGGTTGTKDINDVYSAMQTLQDESDTIDDGTCFNADTPVEYTIGIIDSGDNDPWYIHYDLMQHITGGSLRTASWTRTTGTNTGIVIVPVSAYTLTSADYADDGINHNVDNDVGTLLEIIDNGGSTAYLVIRPADSTAANDFDSASGTIENTAATRTATQSGAALTGEQVWANIYTIGTVDDYVHMYVYQGAFDASTPATPATDESSRVYSVNSTSIDYWSEGHIDICVPLNDYTTDTNPTIDSGYLRVFARKGGDLYSSFEVSNSTTSGGRNPVPMQTSVDLNQGTGTKTISFTGDESGTMVDGEIIQQTSGTNAGARGILDLTNSTMTTGGELSYFPIAEDGEGGVLTAIETGETVTGQTSSSAVTTNGTPQDAGPALASWFTNSAAPDILFGYTNVAAAGNRDIDNNGTDEHWMAVVDCNSNPLDEVYEWLKYICQYTQGETDPVEQAFEDDLSQSDIYGEEYVGATGYFGYSGGTGSYATLPEGEGLTQQTSSASGYVICHDTANDLIVLRNTRGTWNASDTIDSDYDSDTFTPDEAANFAASVASPFGTFAGGTFFGARGILLDNWLSADENSFILTDIEGNTRERPTAVEIRVTNCWGNAISNADADLVTAIYLDGDGGDPDKDLLTCDGGDAALTSTLNTSNIPDWVPSSGRLLLTDVSTTPYTEYVLTYSSWSSTTDAFTLDSTSAFTGLTTGTNATTLVSTTDELDGLSRGDLIWNNDQTGHAYVTSVNTSTNTVTLDREITGQTSADTAVYANVLPILTTSSDTVLPYIIHTYPTATTASASIIYPGSTVYYRVRVRNTREDDLVNGPIKPYSSDSSADGTAATVTTQTVRSIDTIIS